MEVKQLLCQRIANALKTVTIDFDTNDLTFTLSGLTFVKRNPDSNEITLRMAYNDVASMAKAKTKAQRININDREFDQLFHEIEEDEEKGQPKTMNIYFYDEDIEYECYPGFFSWQAMTYARPKHDLAIINATPVDRAYFETNILDTLGLDESQIIFLDNKEFYKTSEVRNEFGYVYAEQLKNEDFFNQLITDVIRPRLVNEKYDHITFIPRSSNTHWWRYWRALHSRIPKELQSKVTTHTMELSKFLKFGNKACLHRYVTSPSVPSLFERYRVYESAPQLGKQFGYACTSKEEVLMAYDLVVQQTGNPNVVLKDTEAGGGINIFFFESKEDIASRFEFKPMTSTGGFLVEENLTYDRVTKQKIAPENDGNNDTGNGNTARVDFVGVTFDNGDIFGEPCEQLLNGVEYVGAIKYPDAKVNEILKTLTKQVITALDIRTRGGFDFVVQKFNDTTEMRFFLIDMNVGRNTANAQTFAFAEAVNINLRDVCFMRKNLVIKNRAFEFQTLLDYDDENGNRLLYSASTKRGVFSHSFVAPAAEAALSVIGDTAEHCWQLYNEFEKVVNQNNADTDTDANTTTEEES